MILVNDLDLVPGFTNRHTTILGPEMFDHAILFDPEIPLRTRIFVDWWKSLLFFLQIPGRDHPACLFVVLVVVYARRNILVISSHFIFPVTGIIVLLLSTCDRRLVRGRQMPSKNVLE